MSNLNVQQKTHEFEQFEIEGEVPRPLSLAEILALERANDKEWLARTTIVNGDGWTGYDFDRTAHGPRGEIVTVHERDGHLDTIVFDNGDAIVPDRDGTYPDTATAHVVRLHGETIDACDLIGADVQVLRARDDYQSVLAEYKRNNPDNRNDEAAFLRTRATAMLDAGQFDQAEAAFAKADELVDLAVAQENAQPAMALNLVEAAADARIALSELPSGAVAQAEVACNTFLGQALAASKDGRDSLALDNLATYYNGMEAIGQLDQEVYAHATLQVQDNLLRDHGIRSERALRNPNKLAYAESLANQLDGLQMDTGSAVAVHEQLNSLVDSPVAVADEQ